MINSEVGYVYMITSPSGRIYVGSTNNIVRRKWYYKNMHSKSQIKLYRSFLKYGFNNHIFEIVYKGDIKNIRYYEAVIGLYYNTINEGLNCSLPKYNENYQCVSKETKEKMSISRKNRKKEISEETRNRFRLASLGRKFSLDSNMCNKSTRFTKVININTKEEFCSIAKAARSINKDYMWLLRRLKGYAKNNTEFIIKEEIVLNT